MNNRYATRGRDFYAGLLAASLDSHLEVRRLMALQISTALSATLDIDIALPVRGCIL